MSYTPAEHAAIGAALGYPSCCIDQWVADHSNGVKVHSAIERGSLFCGYRTEDADVPVPIQAGRAGEPLVFVPCSYHASYETPGYSEWGVSATSVAPGPIPEPVVLPPEKILVREAA
jgi:hypothetical protein